MKSAGVVLLVVLGASACSRKGELNYKHCLRLRVGMSKDDLFKIMGDPEETQPFVEGKSLDYLKGRTAYEWSNPADMPSPDHISVEDASGKIESIRCAGAEIAASVYPDAPAAPAAPAARTR